MKYKKMIRSNHRLLTNGFFVESYRYDAFGRRTATVNAEGTERHVWDGDHCLADVDEEGNVLRAYLWGPGVDNLLAVRVGGRNYAALTDIQGTVWGYADERGEIAARWTYDAWGNVLTEEIAESAEALRSVRYRFQGREFSRATGLTNFRARWYDPTTGRWLSKDPIGLSGGLNLYVFCGNDPINQIDPEGLCPDIDIDNILSPYGGLGPWRYGKRFNYRADPFGHGKMPDGVTPIEPHIHQYPKNGGPYHRLDPNGNPLRNGAGKVPKSDSFAFGQALKDLLKYIPKIPLRVPFFPLMIMPEWMFRANPNLA